MMRLLRTSLIILLSAATLTACRGNVGSNTNPTYTVTYHGNDNSNGSVPVDATNYAQGQTVIVLGNTGNLVKTGYSFSGWNTTPDGSGVAYLPAQTFTMGMGNVLLYAQWITTPVYNVTYDGNNNTGGGVPIDGNNYVEGQTVVVLGNVGNLVNAGYSFSGWNTKADGSGTTYTQSQTFMMGAANVTLYAMWSTNPTYTVTYSGNGNTGGSVPIFSTNYEQGQTVTVLGNTGNLVKTGYSFSGWNTKVDGSGTTYTQSQTFIMGAANVTLYAMWTAIPTYTVTYNGNGNTSGSVPVDSTNYQQGQTVTVLGNTGNVVKTGYTFIGWNTIADGSGTTYTQTQTFTMGAANVTLYANWAVIIGFAYVANTNDNSISQYTIGTDGSLTPLATDWVPAGLSPVFITADPLGKYAYVANANSNNISQYVIGVAGSLTPMSMTTVAAGTFPNSVAVDPSGKYAYVTNQQSNNVSQFTIGPTGSLSPMTTATVAAGTFPYSIIVEPSGKYAYVANAYDNNISQYTIGANGALTSMTTATVAVGLFPVAVTVDPLGKHVYVTNANDNNVSQFTIGPTGSLSPMTTATVAAGSSPAAVTIDPSGKYAYVANQQSNNISQYTIGANGALSPMPTATVAAGSFPVAVTVDPSGKYVYVANQQSNNVSQYMIGTDGSLTSMATATARTAPFSIRTVGSHQ
jgi:uncharacterized repeat protein (TIGR02543 family)